MGIDRLVRALSVGGTRVAGARGAGGVDEGSNIRLEKGKTPVFNALKWNGDPKSAPDTIFHAILDI